MDGLDPQGVLVRVGRAALEVAHLGALEPLDPVQEGAQGVAARAGERASPRDHVAQPPPRLAWTHLAEGGCHQQPVADECFDQRRRG